MESKTWHEWTYLQNKLTHRHREQTCGCQGGGGVGGRGMEWEFGVSRCKLLHLEWINHKVLLYSTGNYIQYPVINRKGKEYKKRMSICVWLSHFAVQQKLTQHCPSTTLQFKKKKIDSHFLQPPNCQWHHSLLCLCCGASVSSSTFPASPNAGVTFSDFFFNAHLQGAEPCTQLWEQQWTLQMPTQWPTQTMTKQWSMPWGEQYWGSWRWGGPILRTVPNGWNEKLGYSVWRQKCHWNAFSHQDVPFLFLRFFPSGVP